MTRVIKNPSGYHSRGGTSEEKARHFGQYAKTHGWTGKWSEDEDTGILHLFARRGENETIDIWWLPTGAAHPDMLPIYTLAGEKIKCRNVSAIAVIAAKTADENRLRKAESKQRRQFKVKASSTESLAALKSSSDDELKQMLLGSTISWVGPITGELNTAVVSNKPKNFKVVRNGHDYVNFVYPIQNMKEPDTYGFRSVYLDSIVGIS